MGLVQILESEVVDPRRCKGGELVEQLVSKLHTFSELIKLINVVV